MTDRGRQVYALLRTLLAWAPSPPSSRTGSVLASQQRGFVTKSRFLTCPDCLANGRPDGMHGCETCGGRGEVPDDGSDPYEQKRLVRYGLGDFDQHKDRERQVDDELRRLEFQLAKPVRKVDEQARDLLTRAVTVRDGMYRHGSYAELERELSRVRLEQPAVYELAMTVAYQPWCEEPIEPVRRVVVELCELIASRMEGEIRVPVGVDVWTREEQSRRAKVLSEEATWRGRRDTRAVGERDVLIRAMAGEGLSPTEIGRRIGVQRRTVQRVLERSNGHEEAA